MAIQNNINGTSCIITQFTSSGTWNKNSRTQSLTIIGCSGAGGGGSGRRGLTGAAGGGAGGAYPINIIFKRVPAFVFNNSISVTIGGTAAGGAAQTANTTNGIAGTANNLTSFGTIIVPSKPTAAAGGTATTASASINPGVGSSNLYLDNFNNQVTTGSNTTGTNGSNGVYRFTGSAGGGGSGANSGTPQQAGNGGGLALNVGNFTQTNPGTLFITGSAGGISGGTINGANGTSISLPNNGVFTGGTGGGGGGGQATAGGAVAGNGGNGGTPGGGGGGGGGSINGTNSGAGGIGARGELWVIEYF